MFDMRNMVITMSGIKCSDFKSPSIRGPIDSRKCDKDGTYVCVKVLHVYRAADMWSVKHKLHSSSHGPLAKSKFPMEGERESYVRQCHHGDAYEF